MALKLKKTISILTAVVMMLGVFSLYSCDSNEKEESSLRASESPAEKFKLKIGSYNIAHCRFAEFNPQTIADDIAAQELDIIGIQEVDRFCERSKFYDMAELLSRFTGYHYAYSKAIDLQGNKAAFGQDGEYGTLILSKYPIVKSETFMLESGDREQRVLGYARINVDGKEIDFYNTHLSLEPELRPNQFEFIAEKVKSSKSCIVTGDFNVESLNEFDAIPLNKINREDNKLITFPEEKIAIDNILFTDNIKALSNGVTDTKNSDHYMLTAELEITVE